MRTAVTTSSGGLTAMPIRKRHHAISVVRARPSTQLDEERIRRDCAIWIADRARTRPVIDVIYTRRFVFVTVELTSSTDSPHLMLLAVQLACENLVAQATEYGLVEASVANRLAD